MREQCKYGTVIRDKGDRQDYARVDAQSPEQSRGNGGAARNEPEHKEAAGKPLDGIYVSSQGHKVREK